MFNVRKNGFPFKAWLAGCREARKASPPPAMLLFGIWEAYTRADWVTQRFLKVRELQLARARRDPAKEMVRGAGGRVWQPGLHVWRVALRCLGAPTHPKSHLKDGKLPDKHVGDFWVGVKSFLSLLYPSTVLGLCGTFI